MEWTKRVLTHFEEPLKQAGIFGAVGVSQFSYHFDANRVGGLPILGDIYEEFLPQNKDFIGHNKYPAAVAELLQYLVYFAYGEQTDSEKEKVETKKRSPLRISRQKRMEDLNITAKVIRPETFVVAALMASGQRVSLAAVVLGYIYHGLGDAASNPDNLGKANIIFSIHHVISWLAELFPCLYRRRPDSDCPDDFPTLVCYAGPLGSKLSLPQARHIFRDGRYLSLRASSYREDSRNGRAVIDMGLPEKDSKFLLPIRSAVLPIRVRAELILEPYYPN
ncbi:hypothetical protein Cgig2_005296 [Carnegiea gigantea]|uniref:Uncharacterized protein n=1 Tax=Carnegiea gigantea TaxID=171969 RepID=A0A9Q1GQA3_9CARY|nr:hypothetical protein Cgig2_005296 [Carnegiea gigantea]